MRLKTKLSILALTALVALASCIEFRRPSGGTDKLSEVLQLVGGYYVDTVDVEDLEEKTIP